jgi:hypothetical protein
MWQNGTELDLRLYTLGHKLKSNKVYKKICKKASEISYFGSFFLFVTLFYS